MTTTSCQPEAAFTGQDAVLRWAAGHPVPPPEDVVFDDDVLLDLVDRHAVSGRLLWRLDAAPPPVWLRPQLRRRLVELRDDTRALLTAHATAAAEITAELGAPSEPVLVKGISTFLVTGAQHTIRCGDIDLVCPDGDRAVEVLTRLGYRRTRAPFMHEVGEFTRDRTEVDVHSYFPVHGYGDLRRLDLDPAGHPGVWTQPAHRASLRRIRHRDLFHDRIRRPVDGPPAGYVSAPDPCLLAIILCAHAFMNYTNIWSISHRAKPYIRLAELADLVDLARHEAFDRDRFVRMVQRFDAADAVRWAGWMSTTLLGWNPLPAVEGEPTADGFPRCLWWSFWARTPVRSASLLHPGWLDIAELFETLGTNVVALTNGPTVQLAIGADPAVPDDQVIRTRRQLCQESTQPPPAWTIDVTVARDGALIVAVGLPSRQVAAVERVRVDLGAVATEWSLMKGGPETAVGGHVGCALGRDRSGRRRLELRYDADTIDGTTRPANLRRPAGEISMLVGVATGNAAGDTTTSVLVPVTVRLDRAAGTTR